MKIKLSKSQWEGIGKKAGWMKVAGVDSQCLECGFGFETERNKKNGIVTCPKCKRQFQQGSEVKVEK